MTKVQILIASFCFALTFGCSSGDSTVSCFLTATGERVCVEGYSTMGDVDGDGIDDTFICADGDGDGNDDGDADDDGIDDDLDSDDDDDGIDDELDDDDDDDGISDDEDCDEVEGDDDDGEVDDD